MRGRVFLTVALHLPLAAAAAAAAVPVCGTALAEDGSPVPAARAELLPMVPAYRWELDLLAGRGAPEPVAAVDLSGGRFCLAVPADGVWKVAVRAPGHVPMVLFPLAPTDAVELPPVRLPRDEGVSVLVEGAQGQPPDGGHGTAWVVATSADRSPRAGPAGDGWRPDLRFAPVPAGGRLRLPRAPGETLELRRFAAGSALVVGARSGADPVRIAPPSDAVPRLLEVVDEGGEPLAGVTVTLAEHGWPVALTGEDGRAALAGGAVELLLEAEDGRRRVVGLPPASTSPSSAPAPTSGPVRFELPPTPAVRGRVLDGAARRPLPGARVWLAPDPGTHAVTGPVGGFTLAGGGRERVRVEAEAPGHLRRAAVAERADLAAGRPLELLLQPAGTVTGRVVDAEGRPLEAVTLAAAPEAPRGPRPAIPAATASLARTGSDGRFRLPSLRPGIAHRIAATRDGSVGRTLPGVIVPPRERTIDLGDLVLRPGARLAGRAVDARDRPVGGAEIRWREAAGLPVAGDEERLRERPPDAVAGPDGRFELPDLAPGRPLDLLATRRGYLPAWTLAVEVSGTGGSDPVTVTLAEASRLSGAVVDPEGGPIPGAVVELHWSPPPAGRIGVEPLRPRSRATETDARGEFAFDELSPGDAFLSARADGFLPGESDTLSLPAGGEVTGARLVLRRGSQVAGQVFDPAGEPLPGTRLSIGTTTAVSGAEGAFRLDGVAPGTRSLQAYHPDYRIGLREVQVEPGETRVDVFLEEGWIVSGRTVDEAGHPVGGAWLELRPDRRDAVTGYRASSGDDGGFRIVASEEGTFRLSAGHADFAPAEVGGLEVGPVPVEDVEVVLAQGASVVGRILGLSPDELAAATVEARREDEAGSGAPVAGGVDPEGGYAVHHLPPGSWRIRAELSGGRRQAEAAVSLDPGVREVTRDLEFGRGVTLTGRVSAGGEPIAGAHVQLSGLTAAGERSVVTGHDGAFRIDDLAPGRYRIDVLDRHRALSHVEDLELGADRHVVLDLSSEPLVGTVTDAGSGEPLHEAIVTVRKALGGSGELGPMIELPTDVAGRFVVGHLTPGDYVVSARKPGYAPTDRTVRLSEGAAAPPVSLRLSATGGVTLTVHLANGGTPRTATVGAFDSAGRMVVHDTRTVSDRGFAYFDQIPAGTWDLLVSAAGAAPTWVRAEVPEGRPSVVLPPAAPLVVRVPALMEGGAAGTLTVASDAGTPFFQVDPAGEIRTAWIVSGGLLTLADVPAGSWVLRVDGAQGGTWTGTVVTDGRIPAQVTLE